MLAHPWERDALFPAPGSSEKQWRAWGAIPQPRSCVTAPLRAIFLLPFAAELPKVSGQMPLPSARMRWEMMPMQLGREEQGKKKKSKEGGK